MSFAPEITDKADAAEVRGHLAAAGDYMRDLLRTPADKRDAATFTEDVRSTKDFILATDAMLTAMERAAARPATPGGPEAGFIELKGPDFRSAGQVVTDDEAYKAWQIRGGEGVVEFKLDREVRALLTSGDNDDLDPAGAGLYRPVGTPIPPKPRMQRMFIRDVLLTQATGLAAVPYFREETPLTHETGATTVAEGSAKPEVSMEWASDVAYIRKIAAWIPATTEILEDAPTLRGYIDTRLAYMLDLREEAQVLNGNGTHPNIKGIRQFADVQDQAIVTGDLPATIGRAIGKIENVDGFATFVAVNPLNYWVAVTTRHAEQFDAAGNGPAPSSVPNITWGLDPIRTRAMESGKALVGDGTAATIFDRMATVIRVGNQHSDYFVNNKVAVLAEKRVGLAVWRPDQFVEADVPTT